MILGGYGLAVDDILMEDREGEEEGGDSIDGLSLSSFHSSQVEPDMRIVNKFEEDCQVYTVHCMSHNVYTCMCPYIS